MADTTETAEAEAAAIERILEDAARAVTPECITDPAEVTLRGLLDRIEWKILVERAAAGR